VDQEGLLQVLLDTSAASLGDLAELFVPPNNQAVRHAA
jgi:hypothetical protein